MPLRLVFMGTPDFAAPTLLALVGQGHDIAAVYTRAPQPAGRGMELRPSPVAAAARQFGLEVLTPKTLRDESEAKIFRAHAADAAVVVAYGMILPKPILEAPPLGCLNLHASLLPRWRGAAPINRAIMAGDKESGATIMRMEEGLDTGPMGLVERVPIGPNTTAGELHEGLARAGADLMARALGALERGALTFTPQPEDGVTYAHKIDKGETRIAWEKPWREVHNHCRGLSPFPGAWFEASFESTPPIRVKVLRSTRAEGSGPPGTVLDEHLTVACGGGAIRLVEVQRAGRQPMRADEFSRGVHLPPGTVLS